MKTPLTSYYITYGYLLHKSAEDEYVSIHNCNDKTILVDINHWNRYCLFPLLLKIMCTNNE